MRSPIHGLCAAVFVLTAATSAWAATIKVPGDFVSPQDAVDAAGPGDKIVIQGSHTETITLVDRTGLTIKGKKGATLDAGGEKNALVIRGCSDIVIAGLAFENTDDHAVAIRDSSGVTLSKCAVSDAMGHGIAVGSSQRVTIEKSTFENCGVDAINLDVDLTGVPPSDCVVSKNRIERTDDDGIDATGEGHLIEKNRVENVSNDGVIIDDSTDSSGITVAKNRVEGTGRRGITVYGVGHTIERNRISDVDDDGIRQYGDGCTIEKNKISDTRDDGVDVSGDGNTVSGNKISNAGGDGFDVDGDDNTYTGNKVKGAGDDGMQVTANDNAIVRNQFLKCDDHGIVVQDGRGNSFEKNKALKNDDDDIWTDVPVGDNAWLGNKYKTGNIAP